MNLSQKSALEWFEMLQEVGETNLLEAKGPSDTARSVMESICSFSNEPNAGGGVILYGVSECRNDEESRFLIDGDVDFDKVQCDIATRCKCEFNRPVYPRMRMDYVNGKPVLIICVDELPQQHKPLYFKKTGLPSGAFRRVGTADLYCTDEALAELYNYTVDGYDSVTVAGAMVDEVD